VTAAVLRTATEKNTHIVQIDSLELEDPTPPLPMDMFLSQLHYDHLHTYNTCSCYPLIPELSFNVVVN